MATIRNRMVRTSLVQTERRMKVAKLYLEGVTQLEIGKILECSPATVNSDLKVLREQWHSRAILSIDDRKAEELAKIDNLERSALESFEKSKQPTTTITERYEDIKAPVGKDSKKAKSGGRPVYVPYKKVRDVKIKEGSAGDPRFLEVANKCAMLRLRILGLLKNDNTINNNIQINWAEMYEPMAESSRQDPLELALAELDQNTKGLPDSSTDTHTVVRPETRPDQVVIDNQTGREIKISSESEQVDNSSDEQVNEADNQLSNEVDDSIKRGVDQIDNELSS